MCLSRNASGSAAGSRRHDIDLGFGGEDVHIGAGRAHGPTANGLQVLQRGRAFIGHAAGGSDPQVRNVIEDRRAALAGRKYLIVPARDHAVPIQCRVDLHEAGRIESVLEEFFRAGPFDLDPACRRPATAAPLRWPGRWRSWPPKPPPTNGVMTRTRAGSSLSTVAILSRIGNGVWVEAHTVAPPARTSAIAACGSIGAWAT